MKNHKLWMILGCGIPLFLIFLAPTIGIENDNTLFIFILLMFVIHLFMPMNHGVHNNSEDNNKNEPKDSKKLK